MQAWRLFDYHPEPGNRPIEDWYQGQSEEVQAEFDMALLAFSAAGDWTDAAEITALEGTFLGLYQIHIDIPLPNGDELQYAVIGAWRPDSRNFVLFAVCEVEGHNYDPPLDIPLSCKQAWEKGKGETSEHNFY
jgi:hypothetical protein